MTLLDLTTVETVKGCKKDYDILAKYHYQRVIEGPVTLVYKLVGKNGLRDKLPDPLSVIVFMQPVPDNAQRNVATNNYFKNTSGRAESLALLNRNVLYLARLITDPRFLKRSFATKLLRESLRKLDIPIVETMTPIDFTNKMYTKLGFEIYYLTKPLWYEPLKTAFEDAGIILVETLNPYLLTNRLNCLTGQLKLKTEHVINQFLGGFRNADRFKPGLERSKFILSKIPPPQAYLIWFNPRNPIAAEIRGKNPGTPTM